MTRRSTAALTLAALLAVAACSSGEQRGGDTAGAGTTTPPAATPGAPQTPDPGRSVITVEMVTDEQGNNIFRPAEVEARRGDVVRFTLVSGVHNVHFVADSNPGVQGLPPASALFQLPGQTYDLKVTFPKGEYYFQCDPHALLGMVGELEVEDDD
jgi:plastocyanin